jgi:hypothetical protein
MHDLKDLRAEADRCKRAMGETGDNSLRRRFAARVREFASLADALVRRRKNAKRKTRSKRRAVRVEPE